MTPAALPTPPPAVPAHGAVPVRGYHHGNLRTELLALAERTVAEQGIDALSLRALARELGVSHAAPARHFRDRQALLDALALDGFARLNAAMAAAVSGTDGTLRARFEALVRAYVEFATTHGALVGLMYAHKHTEGASAELRTAGHGALDIVIQVVRDGQDAGLVVPGDPRHLAQFAFMTVHGLAAMVTGDLLDGAPLPTMIDIATEGLWRALGPGGAAAPQSSSQVPDRR